MPEKLMVRSWCAAMSGSVVLKQRGSVTTRWMILVLATVRNHVESYVELAAPLLCASWEIWPKSHKSRRAGPTSYQLKNSVDHAPHSPHLESTVELALIAGVVGKLTTKE